MSTNQAYQVHSEPVRHGLVLFYRVIYMPDFVFGVEVYGWCRIDLRKS